MQSKAIQHFPQYVFREGKKLLWNPILKKAYQNRPEERVRLQVVEYLIHETNISAARISFESPIHLHNDKTASRTDLIVYDKQFKPLLLVECKAADVSLSEKASLQIARYNQKVGAPFLLITNGIEDYWFNSDSENTISLEDIPSHFQSSDRPDRNFTYWSERGFAGNKSHPDSRCWILQSCLDLYESDQVLQFLNFEDAPDEFYLPNYYRIFPIDDENKIAAALSATAFGATKLNLILNRKDSNLGLLSASLDLIANQEPANSIIHSAKGIQKINLSKEAPFNFNISISDQIQSLYTIMLNIVE